MAFSVSKLACGSSQSFIAVLTTCVFLAFWVCGFICEGKWGFLVLATEITGSCV